MKLAAPNVTRALKHLGECQLLASVSKRGRQIYYQVHEDLRVILDNPQLGFTDVIKVSQREEELGGQSREEKISGAHKRTEKALRRLQQKKHFTAQEYASLLNVSHATAVRDIKYLLVTGKVAKEGRSRSSYYVFRDAEE